MEFSDTAPVLHAIAEASDEPLDVLPPPTRRVALDVSPVAPMGMHADMPARARVTVLTRRGTVWSKSPVSGRHRR